MAVPESRGSSQVPRIRLLRPMSLSGCGYVHRDVESGEVHLLEAPAILMLVQPLAKYPTLSLEDLHEQETEANEAEASPAPRVKPEAINYALRISACYFLDFGGMQK